MRGFRRFAKRWSALVLLLLVFAGEASADSLTAYHERVRRAVALIGSIGTSLQGEAQSSVQQRTSSTEGSTLAEVRKILPAEETIEWQGELLRVDNGWLGEALDDYQGMSPTDALRAGWLARIVERLQSLDARLTELESANLKAANKDEEKARLAAILRRDEYNKETADGNAISRIWRRFREWLRKLFPERERGQAPAGDNRAVNNTAQVVVSLLSLAVIVYVAWRFLPRFLRRDLKKRKRKERGARVVLGEKLEADETSADLLAEAEVLARSGDLRGAIRKGYIALLCELHDRKLLRLEQHKTNRDYLRAIETNRTLYEEMKPMTRSFDDHWYGFIPTTDADWQDFRAHYKRAVTSDR
jgi:hypothetical protein